MNDLVVVSNSRARNSEGFKADNPDNFFAGVTATLGLFAAAHVAEIIVKTGTTIAQSVVKEGAKKTSQLMGRATKDALIGLLPKPELPSPLNSGLMIAACGTACYLYHLRSSTDHTASTHIKKASAERESLHEGLLQRIESLTAENHILNNHIKTLHEQQKLCELEMQGLRDTLATTSEAKDALVRTLEQRCAEDKLRNERIDMLQGIIDKQAAAISLLSTGQNQLSNTLEACAAQQQTVVNRAEELAHQAERQKKTLAETEDGLDETVELVRKLLEAKPAQ